MPMSQGNVFSGPVGLQCKAWAVFAGATGVISKSENIASIVRTDVGTYTVTFTTAMPNTQYFLKGKINASDAYTTAVVADTLTTASCRLMTFPAGGIGDSAHCQVEFWH